MKSSKELNLYSRLTLFVLVTFITGYVIVFSYTNLSPSDADSGKPLTSSLMKTVINNMNEINTRLTNAEATITSQSAIISTISPSGAVIAFNLDNCPNGWSPADGGGTPARPDLRGEFIRGLDNGRGVDGGRTIRSWQDGSTRLLMNGSVDPGNPGNFPEGNSANGILAHKPGVEMIGVNTGFWGSYTARFTLRSAMDTNWGGANETRPRNIALLYCIKN